jgi:hypothetical protein
MIFDKTLTLNIDVINTIENELKMLGFKKFKTTEDGFVFKKNPKYPDITIDKSHNSYDNSITYDLTIEESYDYETILKINFTENNVFISTEDNRKTIYAKYFKNEIRKHKIKKLFESDGNTEG